MIANLYTSPLPASPASGEGVIPPSRIREGLGEGRLSDTTIILIVIDFGDNLFY